MEQKNISADTQTADKANRGLGYYAALSVKFLFLLAVLHVSVICITDIADHYDVKIFEYPIIDTYFVWGIFFLPFVGTGFLLIKNNLFRLLGCFLIIISGWDIYLFLKQTAGAL